MTFVLKKWKTEINKLKKLILIVILIYNFYILFCNENFFEKIKNVNFINKVNSKNETTSKSQKALQNNNIIFSPELRTTMLLNGKKYIDKCFNEMNTSKKYKANLKPIISTIIPLYNCEKTINASIASIQNQNLSNFEIYFLKAINAILLN